MPEYTFNDEKMTITVDIDFSKIDTTKTDILTTVFGSEQFLKYQKVAFITYQCDMKYLELNFNVPKYLKNLQSKYTERYFALKKANNKGSIEKEMEKY